MRRYGTCSFKDFDLDFSSWCIWWMIGEFWKADFRVDSAAEQCSPSHELFCALVKGTGRKDKFLRNSGINYACMASWGKADQVTGSWKCFPDCSGSAIICSCCLSSVLDNSSLCSREWQGQALTSALFDSVLLHSNTTGLAFHQFPGIYAVIFMWIWSEIPNHWAQESSVDSASVQDTKTQQPPLCVPPLHTSHPLSFWRVPDCLSLTFMAFLKFSLRLNS